MADKDPRAQVPDLVVPPRRRSTGAMAAVRVPSAPPPFEPEEADLGGEMEIERAPASAATAQPSAPVGHGIDIDLGGGAFDLELERGGAPAPAISTRGPARAPSAASATPASRPGSGLEVAYNRLEPKSVGERGPSSTARALARGASLVLFAATLAALLRFVHRAGRSLAALMPHVFDATSTLQSAGFAIGALLLAIGIGVLGLKLQPRSYAMLTSAGALVLTSLAMLTVALVSTEEHPEPADGALLIPYVVPFALVALALGIAARGPGLFLEGGARRLHAALSAAGGGALAFVAIEISALASRLP